MPHNTAEKRLAYDRSEARREAHRLRSLKYSRTPRARSLAKVRKAKYKLTPRYKASSNAYNKKYSMTSTGRARRLCQAAQQRRASRELGFDLTHQWVLDRLEAGVCELSGLPFFFRVGKERPHPYAPSIDRIDSSKGYLQSNCRLVLWCLNAGMLDFGEEVAIAAWHAVLKRKGIL